MISLDVNYIFWSKSGFLKQRIMFLGNFQKNLKENIFKFPKTDPFALLGVSSAKNQIIFEFFIFLIYFLNFLSIPYIFKVPINVL